MRPLPALVLAICITLVGLQVKQSFDQASRNRFLQDAKEEIRQDELRRKRFARIDELKDGACGRIAHQALKRLRNNESDEPVTLTLEEESDISLCSENNMLDEEDRVDLERARLWPVIQR